MGNFLSAVIRAAKPFMKKLDIEANRKGQDAIGRLGVRALADKVAFEEVTMPQFQASYVTPNDIRHEDVALLYLHGGAYVAGSLEYAKGFGSHLAYHTGLRTLCVGYRLAPEHPYPAALEDAMAAYALLREAGCSKIILAGESAGGGLAYALTLRLKAEGLPLPLAIVAISPWTDLTCSGPSYQANLKADPTLFEENLRAWANCYAEGRLKEPCVSPAFGDTTGFPPSLIFAGTIELLMSDAVMMRDNLTAHGADCTLHLEEGMWHVYVLFGTQEAKAAIKQICEFTEEVIANAVKTEKMA